MKKCVGFVLIVFCLSIFLNTGITVYAGDSETWKSELTYKDVIPLEADNYVVSNFEEIIDISSEYMSDFNISDEKELTLGTPYCVVNLGVRIQDEIYYYPVVADDEIVFIISVIGTDAGYTYSVQTALVDELNQVDYINNPAVIYVCNKCIYVETEYSENVYDYSELTSQEIDFVNLPFEEKFLFAQNNAKYFIPYKTDNDNNDYISAKLKTTLTLYKPMGQYGYAMCWASAAATIINYLNHTAVTGFQVCNRVGIGYNDGGTIYDAQDGLSAYGINYKLYANALTWSSIVSNISSGKPIFAGLSSNSYGDHAVTIYGYSGTTTSNKKIYVWDSALNSDNGGYSYMNSSYNYAGASGITYQWNRTLSYY